MKLSLTLIAAGITAAAFSAPAAARSVNSPDAGYVQLTRNKGGGHNTPPGWRNGNKTGWNGHRMPPGQWKKYKAERERQRRDRWERSNRDRNDRYRNDDRNDRSRYDDRNRRDRRRS